MNLVSFDSSNSTGAFDAKMNGSLLEEDSSFKMLGLNFFSKLDRSSYIISIVKRALIRSMKFLSPEVALYLYKSTIQPWVERCCHVWADTGVEHPKNVLETEGGWLDRITILAGEFWVREGNFFQ